MKGGSRIFELYGYPVDDWSCEAMDNLKLCHCPFMNEECDGGGNRFSSAISLSGNHRLKGIFPGKASVQSGVCSLLLHDNEQPWIVCPRRLLNYRSGVDKERQVDVKRMLCEKSGLIPGLRYSVWSEVKMKCRISNEDKSGCFDYTFDYVITGRARKSLDQICDILGCSSPKVADMLTRQGFATCRMKGELYCDDFPSLPLVIVEMMTSSTSGGNKKKRTQIAQLFEDTVLKLNGADAEPAGPGINYRQVWARMVSQLLVKSQIGKAWGGSTFWVVQDLLAKYISETTALNFSDFLAQHQDEVNVISGGYGDDVDPLRRMGKIAEIRDVKFYSGKVAPASVDDRTFSDIIRLGVTPPRSELLKKLLQKRPCATFVF